VIGRDRTPRPESMLVIHPLPGRAGSLRRRAQAWNRLLKFRAEME